MGELNYYTQWKGRNELWDHTSVSKISITSLRPMYMYISPRKCDMFNINFACYLPSRVKSWCGPWDCSKVLFLPSCSTTPWCVAETLEKWCICHSCLWLNWNRKVSQDRAFSRSSDDKGHHIHKGWEPTGSDAVALCGGEQLCWWCEMGLRQGQGTCRWLANHGSGAAHTLPCSSSPPCYSSSLYAKKIIKHLWELSFTCTTCDTWVSQGNALPELQQPWRCTASSFYPTRLWTQEEKMHWLHAPLTHTAAGLKCLKTYIQEVTPLRNVPQGGSCSWTNEVTTRDGAWGHDSHLWHWKSL